MVNRPIVQWVLEGKDIEVLMPDGTKAFGISDANGLNEGDIAYLDKFGYARVDKIDEKRTQLVFAHK